MIKDIVLGVVINEGLKKGIGGTIDQRANHKEREVRVAVNYNQSSEVLAMCSRMRFIE